MSTTDQRQTTVTEWNTAVDALVDGIVFDAVKTVKTADRVKHPAGWHTNRDGRDYELDASPVTKTTWTPTVMMGGRDVTAMFTDFGLVYGSKTRKAAIESMVAQDGHIRRSLCSAFWDWMDIPEDEHGQTLAAMIGAHR